jgi:pimeloyl-ACP methyl ester carboxylesterase
MFDAHAFGRLLWRGRRRLLDRAAGLPGDFVRTDYADIRVLDTRRPGASAQTLVIVPDPPNVIEHVMPMVEAFAPDYRVVVFELPGFGHSYPNAGFRYDIAGQALAIEELFRRLDIRDAVLDMSCLGAYMGLMFAKERPARVRHLMLQQVPAFREAQAWARQADVGGIIRTPWIGQLFMRAMYRKVADHWYHSALPEHHDEHQHAHYAGPTFAALERGGCFCLGDAYQSLLAEPALPLSGLSSPTTVVWGAADRTHDKTSHASVLQDVPHARFVEFAGCGHFPALEAPADYYPLLRDALEKH